MACSNPATPVPGTWYTFTSQKFAPAFVLFSSPLLLDAKISEIGLKNKAANMWKMLDDLAVTDKAAYAEMAKAGAEEMVRERHWRRG